MLTLFQSELHPHALTFDPEPFEAGEVTRAELAALQGDLRAPDIIRALRVNLPINVAGEMLDETGFGVVGRTRLLKLSLPEPEPRWSAALPAGFRALWAPPGAEADWQAWLAFHFRQYAATHLVNPASDPGPAGYRAIFAADLVEALFLHNARGRLAGVASLRPDGQIGWVYADDEALIEPLLGLCVQRAVAAGWPLAEIEADDTEDALWRATTPRSGDTVQDYVTWQWDRR